MKSSEQEHTPFDTPPTSDEVKILLQEVSSAIYDAYIALEKENRRLRETKAQVFIQTVSGDEAVGKPVKEEEYRILQQQLAEARALLEEAHYWLDALAKHAARPTVEKMAAFLAESEQ